MTAEFKAKVVIDNFNKIKVLMDNIEKSIDGSKNLSEGFKTVSKGIEKATEKSKDLNNQLAEAKNGFKTLISGTFLDRLSGWNDRLNEISDAWEKVGKGGGFTKQLTGMLTNIGDKAKNVSGIFKEMIGGTLTKLPQILSASFSSLAPALASAVAAFGPLVAVIGLVTAAVLTLKRMWKLNIGGMQTTFFKIVGKMQDIWAKFTIMFDKSLRKLSPMFSVVFKTLEFIALPVLAAIEGLIEGIFVGVQPLLDAFSELFKPFEEMMGIQSKGQGFKKFLEGIKVIFKGIGMAIRVSLFPLELMIKLSTAISKVMLKMKDALDGFTSKHPMLSKILQIFKNIVFPITAIVDGIKYLVSNLDKIKSIFGIGDKDKNKDNTQRNTSTINRGAIERQVGSMNSTTQNINNNNQSFTVQTSAAITKDSAPQIFGSVASGLDAYNRGAGS